MTSIKSGVGNEYVFKLEKRLVSGLLARSYDRYYLLWDKQKNEIKLLSSGKVISFKTKEKTESNKAKSADAKSHTADYIMRHHMYWR